MRQKQHSFVSQKTNGKLGLSHIWCVCVSFSIRKKVVLHPLCALKDSKYGVSQRGYVGNASLGVCVCVCECCNAVCGVANYGLM